jgi:hypothetical protein
MLIRTLLFVYINALQTPIHVAKYDNQFVSLFGIKISASFPLAESTKKFAAFGGINYKDGHRLKACLSEQHHA